MIHTQESQRKEEQKQRAQFDRAQMLQNEMDSPPTIRMDRMTAGIVNWNNEGVIYTKELEEIIKEFKGHFILDGRLYVGGLE